MSRKKIFIVGMLILSSMLFLQGQEIVEAIVAIINDDVITLSDYKQQHEALYQAYRNQFQGEDFEIQFNSAKEGLLDQMITDLLLLQEAKRMQLDVTEQLNMMIENIKVENRFKSDEQLRQAMLQQGMNFDAWKHEMKNRLLREGIIFTEVSRDIVLDDTKIVNYYRGHPEEFTELPEYRLKGIYIATEGRVEEELQEKKKEIEDKLAEEEDFGAVAGSYSEGPERESQGDLGSFKEGELDKILEQAVKTLEVGKITSWLKTANGWYLLRLEERKESRLKSFDEVRQQIQERLFSEQQDKKLAEYLDKLKKRSYIKILISNPLNI